MGSGGRQNTLQTPPAREQGREVKKATSVQRYRQDDTAQMKEKKHVDVVVGNLAVKSVVKKSQKVGD